MASKSAKTKVNMISAKKKDLLVGSKVKTIKASTTAVVRKGEIGPVPLPRPYMRNLKKDQTGLPVNVWIDEGGTYKKGGHGPRIKFQINKHTKIEKGLFLSMGLDGHVFGKESMQKKLSKAEIAEIQKYVEINKAILIEVMKMEKKLDDKLIEQMKNNYKNGGKKK